MLSGTSPSVTDVFVSSTAWSADFLHAVEATYQSTGGVPIQNASQPFPWTNVNRISIRFSEDVDVEAGDLSISAINSTGFSFTDFYYDAIGRLATWTLSKPLIKNTYRLDLDGDGIDPVHSASGPSMLADFEQQFQILPGDVNQDSSVTGSDHDAVLSSAGLDWSSPSFNPLLDLDGSSQITSADAQQVYARIGTSSPLGTPVGATNDAPTSLGDKAIPLPDASIDHVINLRERFADAETASSQITFKIVSVTSKSLFDKIGISNGNLTLSAATGCSGLSEIRIEATDTNGLKTSAIIYVDVGSANVAPELEWHYQAEGPNGFRLFGWVNDDYESEGLIVEFSGAVNIRATVNADGQFDFGIVLLPEEWGNVTAKVVDRHGTTSNEMTWWVGIS